MKIHVLCDLHIEFGGFVPPLVGADVVVLAGDVHVKERGLQWIFDQKFEVPVIYVLGNHEFYGEKFPGLINKLNREAEGTNVHVLENDSVRIGGFRFFGCTLWSDMALFGNPHIASVTAAEAMNDYRLIRNSKTYRRLTPDETTAWHRRSVKKLKKFLERGDPDKSVVVTHHTPSIKSIAHRYRNHPITPAFASNMDSFVLEQQPRLWIHGHTHESFDYCIGKTRIVCNPRGYVPQADNRYFNPNFTISLIPC
ncbi:MAG: metallophosphoesterase [Desulfosarcina sp.]|nr:metallophosphoesterase [Desulfobacterales bacterium]